MGEVVGGVVGPRTRTGCTNCRVRHLKCDENHPICKRCQKDGRECIRGYNVRFRYGTDLGEYIPATNDESPGGRPVGGKGGDFKFRKDQIWVKTPDELSFVDETDEIARSYLELTKPLSPVFQHAPSPHSSHSPSSARAVSISDILASLPDTINSYEPTPNLDYDLSSGGDNDRSGYAPVHNHRSAIPLEDLLQRPLIHDVDIVLDPLLENASGDAAIEKSVAGVGIDDDHQAPELHLSCTMWPLEDLKIAQLFRHYIEVVGVWFDMHDSLKHFTTVVPLKSATCPMLLDAMLAFAARHLSHIAGMDPYIASTYHNSCLRAYIPALTSTAGETLDSSLLATTVILRAFKELDVTQAGADDEHYLLGYKIFGEPHPSRAVYGGLRQACFWVYLRQDIYVSILHQRPLKTNLNNLLIDRGFSPADDLTWANRITFKCAEILEFSFGSTPTSAQTWESLSADVDTWERTRPDSFNPIFSRDRHPLSGQYFPELWYVLEGHATAVQHYHLSRILLAIYNPSILRTGLDLAAANRKLGIEVRNNIRAICGIARNNRPVPAMFTACHIVYVCGEWIEDAGEQGAMLSLLGDTERVKGWPTAAAAGELRELWGLGADRDGGERDDREVPREVPQAPPRRMMGKLKIMGGVCMGSSRVGSMRSSSRIGAGSVYSRDGSPASFISQYLPTSTSTQG